MMVEYTRRSDESGLSYKHGDTSVPDGTCSSSHNRWLDTAVSHHRALYNYDHPLLVPLPTLYPNLSSRGLGVSGDRGCKVSVQGGERYGSGVVYCGWCGVQGVVVHDGIGVKIWDKYCGTYYVPVDGGCRSRKW